MPPKRLTFGQFVSTERRRRLISQKDFAAILRKEDGQPLSPTYLNDIEHDRCNIPAEYLLKQFAKALKLDLKLLYYYAGKIPENLRNKHVDGEKILAAYQAFEDVLYGKVA